MNTGQYVTPQEFLDSMYPSLYVSYRSKVTLSNKNVDTFEYTGSSFTLASGDIVTQGEFASVVNTLQTTPDRLTLDDGTEFVDGEAKVYRSSLSLSDIDGLIQRSMDMFDAYTGQWFNKRDFVGVNALEIEGDNSNMIHFPVPILEVTSLKINNNTIVSPSVEYRVYSSRVLPDDRNNPKIKHINTLHGGMFNTIEGSFGYLEPDGSTPTLVKTAISRLAMIELTSDPTQLNTNTIKREKTDMHEVEYAVSSDSGSSGSSGGGLSGDNEVDKIILMYKSPFQVGGTNPYPMNLINDTGDYP